MTLKRNQSKKTTGKQKKDSYEDMTWHNPCTKNKRAKPKPKPLDRNANVTCCCVRVCGFLLNESLISEFDHVDHEVLA